MIIIAFEPIFFNFYLNYLFIIFAFTITVVKAGSVLATIFIDLFIFPATALNVVTCAFKTPFSPGLIGASGFSATVQSSSIARGDPGQRGQGRGMESTVFVRALRGQGSGLAVSRRPEP